MTGLSPPGPLAYEGQVVTNLIFKAFAPTTGFINFNIGTIWIDTSSADAYILVSKASGVALWANIGGAPGQIDKITLVPDGTIIFPSASNVTFTNGNGMSLTGSGNNITFTADNAGFAWNTYTTSQILEDSNGYMANSAGLLKFALPTTSSVGDTYQIIAMDTGGWMITQSAGQQIRIGNTTTTSGVVGSVSSSNQGDWIQLVCSVADLSWIGSIIQGNATVV
jgi:hypothetical protein